VRQRKREKERESYVTLFFPRVRCVRVFICVCVRVYVIQSVQIEGLGPVFEYRWLCARARERERERERESKRLVRLCLLRFCTGLFSHV